MRKIFALFAFVFFAALNAEAQLFVGNGGEGYRLGGQIELRDFVEAGLQESDLEWGPAASPEWRHLLYQDALVATLGLDAELLARKLTDFESLQNGLGAALWLAMHGHEWSFSKASLPILAIPRVEHPIVQIAIRKGKNIVLNERGWSWMTSAQKTALVLHEAVSSLSRVYRDLAHATMFTQDHQGARELLAESFRSRLPGHRLALRKKIKAQLSVDQLVHQCGVSPLNWNCSIVAKGPLQPRVTLRSVSYETSWGMQQGFVVELAGLANSL